MCVPNTYICPKPSISVSLLLHFLFSSANNKRRLDLSRSARLQCLTLPVSDLKTFFSSEEDLIMPMGPIILDDKLISQERRCWLRTLSNPMQKLSHYALVMLGLAMSKTLDMVELASPWAGAWWRWLQQQQSMGGEDAKPKVLEASCISHKLGQLMWRELAQSV